MPDYIHVPFIPYDTYYDPESAHYKSVNHDHSNHPPSPINLIKIIINITLSNKMLSIASISLSCCCLLAIVSSAPLEHGEHHEKRQENGIKHIDNHHESGVKPTGIDNDHVSALKIEAEIQSPGKSSPKSPKSPKAYDPEKVARAAAGKVYGEKLKSMPKKKTPKSTIENGNNSVMQKEWAKKLADLWKSDEMVQANVEPMYDSSIEEDMKQHSGMISVY